MLKLLSTLILIFAIMLFPPAVLAFVSQNSVPGDAAYPIKRKLEDGILKIASLNPTTKALFSVDLSNRRFKESTTLLAEGKSANQTLNELVTQTSFASTQIDQVQNQEQKEALQKDLQSNVEKYITTLATIQTTGPSGGGSQSSPGEQTSFGSSSVEVSEESSSPESSFEPSSAVSSLASSSETARSFSSESSSVSSQTASSVSSSASSSSGTSAPTDTATICANARNGTGSVDDTIRQLCGLININQATGSTTQVSSSASSTQIQSSSSSSQAPAAPAARAIIETRHSESSSQVNTTGTPSDCRDNPVNPPAGYTWKADCSKQCSSNDQCPQNTFDSGVDRSSSSWCYGFKGPNHSSADWRCLMLVTNH